jgi:hypothetical protein
MHSDLKVGSLVKGRGFLNSKLTLKSVDLRLLVRNAVHGLKFMVPCQIMELARLLCKGYKLPSSMLPPLSKNIFYTVMYVHIILQNRCNGY